MSTALTFAPVAAAPPVAELSFRVCYSRKGPAYHQLLLEIDQECVAHWVMPLALDKVRKRNLMLWRSPELPAPGSLQCLETGPVQVVSDGTGTAADLRAGLRHGSLQLRLDGELLRGYYRLCSLPEGHGQLWQLKHCG
jgi:hypothetical protein